MKQEFKPLVLDIEGSCVPNHNPWSNGSYLTSVGVVDHNDTFKEWVFNHSSCDTSEDDMQKHIVEIQKHIDECSVIVIHNAIFDVSWLRYIGCNVDNKEVWCTQVADYLINGQDTRLKYNLNAVSLRYDGEEKHDLVKEHWDRGIETYDIPLSILTPYLEQDLRVTKHIFECQIPIVKQLKIGKLVRVNMELSKMLSEMESTGIGFDKQAAEKYVEEYAQALEDLDKSIYNICGWEFNLSSSKQLAAALFGGDVVRDVQEFVCKPRKDGTVRVYTRKAKYTYHHEGMGFTPDNSMISSKTGAVSTGKDVLTRLRANTTAQKELLVLLNDRRAASKTYTTLVSEKDDSGGLLRKIGRDGRIHPNFNQTTTRTGRLSSSNPNGQNLPRSGTSPLKKLFVASDGHVLINGDLSQIEWRTDAGMSRDPIMMQEIIDGIDVHSYVGEEFFGGDPADPKFKSEYRQPAKTFNFRMIYDGKAKSFYADHNMPNFPLKKWEKIVKSFWEKYHVLRAWALNNARIVEKTRGWLRQPSSRLLNFVFHTENTHEYKRGYSLNEIHNYPIQSISADMMHLAMLHIYNICKKENLAVKFALQVHDSLVVEAKDECAARVAQIMMDVFNNLGTTFKDYYGFDIMVPLTGEVSFGTSYGSMPYEYDTKSFSIEKFNEDLDKLRSE